MSGKNLAIFFISIFILFSVSIKSQVGDSLYYVDPHGFIAREIFSKKIVMLGDGGHHQPGVYHYLLGTLNKWLELCRTKTEEENLTLIIEDEESMSNEINNYIKSGDMQTVVGKILGFNLEDLEYYSNLRKFSLAVDSINRHREKS